MSTTEIEPYAAGMAAQYQPQMVMTPEDARALDEQVRRCTEAVLREGVDYGHIPGTNGEEKSLWRPGAQKLLQWFRLECTCERIEIERDDEGRKHGITYRAEVGRGLKTATPVILATCEGTADYDESKFYQSEEQVRARLRDAEHKWAAKDRRAPNADRWNSAREYRADWNALMKRAQKRAIVGAVNDATAAGGIFSDREEDDSPAPQDDGPTWYEQALEAALTFTDADTGRQLYREATQAHKEGLCTRRQQDHVQNRITQRARLLKTATPADVEDLGRQAAQQPAASERPASAAPDETPASGPAADAGSGQPEDEPGSVGGDQLKQLHTILTGLGFGDGDREQKLTVAEMITGRAPLTGPKRGRSSGNLSWTEADRLIAKLDEFTSQETGERDREALIAWMAGREQAAGEGGGDEQ
jgi:hypothetical protein